MKNVHFRLKRMLPFIMAFLFLSFCIKAQDYSTTGLALNTDIQAQWLANSNPALSLTGITGNSTFKSPFSRIDAYENDNIDLDISAPFPSISSFTPASGPVGTPVTINGTNLSSLTSVTIGGVAAIPISNTGTQLVAMVMPGAATGIINVTTTAGTANSASSFTIAISTGPTTQQGSKLVGTGYTGTSYQGYSVSLSADGNTAIIGGYGDNSNTGAAWIFTRTAGTWSQQGTKLVGTGNTGASNQGRSVSLSADGNTAIVGGSSDNNYNGAAWIFTRAAGVWSQQGAMLVGTGNIGSANQGISVSLSADGNTAIIGGSSDNNSVGAAWIFTRTAGVWSQQGAKLVGTGYTGAIAGQGFSVSLSADGNTAILGGWADDTYMGAAWIFTRTAGVWSQQGTKLVGTGNNGAAKLGQSVSVSADGNTAIVGGYADNSNIGAAWIFTRTAGVWSQQGTKLVGTGYNGNSQQGSSVSLSADGNTALIGGQSDDLSFGATWIFTRNAGTWTQQGAKLVGTGIAGNALQGFSGSLSADGNTAIIGGAIDNASIGAAWIFNGSLSSLAVNLLTFSGRNNGAANLLQWTTSAEENNAYFDIERSVDGVQFNKAGSTASQGNSSSNRTYTFNDNITGISNQVFYYRLKMVDQSGTFKYSAIVKIKLNSHQFMASASPNPFTGSVNVMVETTEEGSTEIQLLDAQGRTIQQKKLRLQKGNNVVMFNQLENLSPGIYMMKITTGSESKSIKIIKQ